MEFPHPFIPDATHRAGRMMSAGRCKVTVQKVSTGEHITVLFKCFADNRERQYNPDISKNWIDCPLRDATHIFTEVPKAGEGFNDKIGTFYPKGGKWYDADNADPRRVDAAMMAANWIVGNTPADGMQWGSSFYTFQEADECGVCGKELTDPESIPRGIGPVCLGKATRSHHQIKNVDAPLAEQTSFVDNMDEPPPMTGRSSRDTSVTRLVEALNELPEGDRGTALGLACAKVIDQYPEAGEAILSSLRATASVNRLTGVTVVPDDPTDFMAR